jgi:hypothetical protein
MEDITPGDRLAAKRLLNRAQMTLARAAGPEVSAIVDFERERSEPLSRADRKPSAVSQKLSHVRARQIRDADIPKVLELIMSPYPHRQDVAGSKSEI